MSAAELLPSNSGAFERAAADALTDTLPVPIRQIVDPAVTPSAFLPFLAAHESVDLWFDDWSEDRKRQMVAEATELAALKGTHEAAVRFLSYVDADVVDNIAYPARFVLGRSALGITPLNHPPFKARYLIKVALERPPNAFILGRSALGLGALGRVSLEPIRRAKTALLISKAPETEYVVTFAWRRPITFGDAVLADGSHNFGGFIARPHL
jgi:P2-related tail formation protein